MSIANEMKSIASKANKSIITDIARRNYAIVLDKIKEAAEQGKFSVCYDHVIKWGWSDEERAAKNAIRSTLTKEGFTFYESDSDGPNRPSLTFVEWGE